MWMMMIAAWLISMVGVAFFLAGSKRYRDADEADDLNLDLALTSRHEAGRKSDVYFVGETSQRAPASRTRVA